jgi:acyl dehydratase
MAVLHGEQYVEIRRPLPPAATVITTPRVLSITDKGRAAVLVIAAESRVEGDSAATPSVYQEITVFARGAGGFGPTDPGAPRAPAATAPADPPPGVPPTATASFTVPEAAALLYRLTGDLNPLHADPEFAALAGFDRPILHGLATLGIAVRAVMDAFAGGDPGLVRSVKGRMASHVFPGDTLETDMWGVPPRQGAPPGWQRVVFIVKARSGAGAQPRTVISGGAVEVGPAGGGDGRARL